MHTHEPISGPVFAEGLAIHTTLSEHKVVFSGVHALQLNYLRSRLVLHSSQVLRRVSKKMTLLVTGDKAQAKHIAAANELGVRIVSTDELLSQMQPFTLEHAKADQSPDQLLTALQAAALWEFKPQYGTQLLALLHRHEAQFGVTSAHHFCSRWLAANDLLRVMTPFPHPSSITTADVSPDGRWLVTSSFQDPGAKRVTVQVWNAQSGALVQQFQPRFTVGWSDRNGAIWSPDSKRIAVAYNTNIIGIWEPFGGSLQTYASVTDGYPEPPGFGWSTDGAFVYIACPNQFKPGGRALATVDNMGSWMPADARGDATDITESGAVDSHSHAHRIPWTETPAGRQVNTTSGTIVLGERSLSFSDAEGNIVRSYDFTCADLGGPQACLVGSFEWPMRWMDPETRPLDD